MLHQPEEAMPQHRVVVISVSTRGINVTCEVLSPFLVPQNFAVCCVGVIWKTRDERADCTAHRYFDFSEELTEEKQDKNTALDKTQIHQQWIG